LSLDNNTERAHKEHSELVALCEAGMIEEACNLLKSHIEHAGASLRDFLLQRA
jgi:DNA-binding GntR family transcriptional regulator